MAVDMNAYSSYSDEQIVAGLLANDRTIIEYFFYKKCSGLLSYIIYNVFRGNINRHEILNELFLYLADNNWAKLRQFDFRSKLTTWLGVVAIRFFQKKRERLIENESTEDLIPQTTNSEHSPFEEWTDIYDVHCAIKKMKNERYKTVIKLMDLQGNTPESVAALLGVSIANLYNLRHRAHVQLASVMRSKGGLI